MTGRELIAEFSLDERERRYRLVRERMRARGLDALVVTGSTGKWDHFQADVRYLTQIGGNCTEGHVVFPLTGEPTFVIREPVRGLFWRQAQDWVEDIRDSDHCHWSVPIIARVRELGLERARIGITGLSGVLRAPEGYLPVGTYENLRAALPAAEFVGTPSLVQEVRQVKSDEEVAFLERAGEALDAGIAAMIAAARPGVPDYVVYGRMIGAMMEAGGDYNTMAYWKAEPAPSRTEHFATRRRLQKGDVIINEIDGRYAGYGTQGIHPVVLGPKPQDYDEMAQLSSVAFERILATIRPGLRFGALFDVLEEVVAGSPYTPFHPLFHGQGLGEDEPMDLGGDGWRTLDIRAGMVLMIQPTVGYFGADGGRRRISVGDTVLVTPDGARRLSRRAMAFESVAC